MNTIDLDLGEDFKSIDLDNNFSGNNNNSVKFAGYNNSSPKPSSTPTNPNPPRLVVHERSSPKSSNLDLGADMLFNPDKIKKRPASPGGGSESSFGKSLYNDIDKPSQPKISSPSFPDLDNSKGDGLFDDLKSFDMDSGIKPPTDFNFDDLNSANTNLFDTPSHHEQPQTIVRPKTEEEIQNEKFELLLKLERLKQRKDVTISRNFTMSSDLEDIKQEYEKLVYMKRVDNWTKQCKRGLIFCVNGIEMLNNKYDPFEVDLDGWSDEVYADQDEYDDIFEELYDKYKEKGTMAPELKLLFALGGSAFAFTMKKSLFRRAVPGMDEVMRQNPDVLKNFFQDQGQQMPQQAQYSQPPPRRPDMREPDNVDDIINRLSQATSSEDVKNINVPGRGGRDISLDI